MIDMQNPPVLVFPNLLGSAEALSVLLARFNLYGSKVYELSNGQIQKIVILAGVKENVLTSEKISQYKYLQIIRVSDPSKNVFKFAAMSRTILKTFGIRPRLLVSSDVYIGFLTTFFTLLLLRIHVPIQVSLHGKVLRDEDSSINRFIRQNYLALVLRLAGSIRIVSKALELEILSQFKIQLHKVFIAPIPVELPNIGNYQKSKVIAFVGRLHEERGVEEWVEIVCQLSRLRQDFSVYLIGDGPLQKKVKLSFETDSPKLPLKVFGYLTKSELNKIWPEIKILLSSAKDEGYGLSLREAILSSAYVVARSNSGSEVLRDELPHLVFTYNDVTEAVLKLNLLLELEYPDFESEKFRVRMKERNLDSLHAIAKSWIS